MKAGAASMAEGLIFMKKLGGLAAGGLAKGAGLIGKGSGLLGGKGGGGPDIPELPYDARPVEETPPAALPGGRGAPADRMLEKPEPPTYTGRAPRGAKQLTGGSTTGSSSSWDYGEKEREPVKTGVTFFKDGTRLKMDLDGANNILSIKMKKPDSDDVINLTRDEFVNYFRANIGQQEGSFILNRITGQVAETDEYKQSSYVIDNEKLKEAIDKLDSDEW